MDARFTKRHEWDSRFWVFVWLYSLIVILFGFAPPVQDRFFDDVQEPASIALQLHVWSFSAWMSLLAIQAFLVGMSDVQDVVDDIDILALAATDGEFGVGT